MSNNQQKGYGSNPSPAHHNQQPMKPRGRISTNVVIVVVVFTLILAIVTTVVTVMNVKRKNAFEPPLAPEIAGEVQQNEPETSEVAEGEVVPDMQVQPSATPESSVAVATTEEVYASEVTGLRFALPDGWSVSTSKEIKRCFQSKVKDVQISAISTETGATLHIFAGKSPSAGMNILQLKEYCKMEMTKLGYAFADDRATQSIAGKIYDVLQFDLDVEGTIIKNNLYLRQDVDTSICIMMQYANNPEEETKTAIKNVIGAIKAY